MGCLRDLTQSRKLRTCSRSCPRASPDLSSTDLIQNSSGPVFSTRFGPPTGCAPVNWGTAFSGGTLRSPCTVKPEREITRLPFEPQNSRPPFVWPAQASRCDQRAVRLGYSSRASWVSGVSPLSSKQYRPPVLVTAVGPFRLRYQWAMSSEWAARLVIWPPE